MQNIIHSFREDYYFLSNFYQIPVTYDGITYQNNEAAFQAQKYIKRQDRYQFATLTPSEAKHLGRKVLLRKDWEFVKVSIMKEIVLAKFLQNPGLQEKLLATKDSYLIEGNNWNDRIWGQVNGQGRNLLGQILMEIREQLAKEQENTEIER